MRHIKISQRELINVRRLYESVMSNACYGLFFREGSVYGAEIAAAAIKDRENFLEIAKKELIERGWVEDITFGEDKVTVKGSVEVAKHVQPTCHRLRGIIRHLLEAYKNEKVHCTEQSCQSVGNDTCVFKIESIL